MRVACLDLPAFPLQLVWRQEPAWRTEAVVVVDDDPRVGVATYGSDADERAAASAVALARLDLDPKLRDALARLGVTRVGELVRLPAGGILERFGHDAHRLYQLAAGERWDPLVPVAPPEAPDERVLLDEEDDDSERLVFAMKGPLDRLLARLAARGRALAALHVELTLKH